MEDAGHQYTLIDRVWHDGAMSCFWQDGQGAGFGVESQVGFTRIGIGAVTGVAAIREDGLNIGVEVDAVGQIPVGPGYITRKVRLAADAEQEGGA